jgi:predicted nucleic acid-binding protein
MNRKSVLVDTSIIIDYLRLKNKKETYLYKLIKRGFSIKISMITHTELYAGKSVWENRKVRSVLEKLVGGFQILKLTEERSLLAGELRAHLDMQVMDAIIAATALSKNLPLASFNYKHFKDVEGLELFHLGILKE